MQLSWFCTSKPCVRQLNFCMGVTQNFLTVWNAARQSKLATFKEEVITEPQLAIHVQENTFNKHLPQRLSPGEACLTSSYLKWEAEVCEELVILRPMFCWSPWSALLCCSPQMYSFAGKSLEKELNSPNNSSNLRLILRVLALWRVISKQGPELSSQKKKSSFYVTVYFSETENSHFQHGSLRTATQQVFPLPQAQQLTQLYPNSNPAPWVKIKTVSRTFISAIKAINWFLGHVLTQRRNGVCCMAHTLTPPLHGTDV